MTMSPSLRISGLADRTPLPIGRLLDDATVDENGGLTVSIVDVLAAVRLRASAEIVVIEFADGSSLALTVPTLSDAGTPCLTLDPASSSVRLASPDSSSSPAPCVIGMLAMSFASFVGGQW